MLMEIGHPRPLILMVTDNQPAEAFSKEIAKQRRYIIINMNVYYIRDKIDFFSWLEWGIYRYLKNPMIPNTIEHDTI